MVLVKSATPEIPDARRPIVVTIAAIRFLIRVGLRSGSGLMISASRSSRSVASSSWVSVGNWRAVWRRVVMSLIRSSVLVLWV